LHTYLYEQENIRQELCKCPENRTHFLSLVCKLPKNSQDILKEFSEKCTEKWDKRTYYSQNKETYHLTIVGFGSDPSKIPPVDQLIENINSVLKRYNNQDIYFYLTEPLLAKSGVNYMIEPSEEMVNMSSELQEHSNYKKTKLTNRNISLIRYLIPEDSFKLMIKNQMIGIKDLIMDYKEKILVKELLLVRLDKVADYFETIHTFSI